MTLLRHLAVLGTAILCVAAGRGPDVHRDRVFSVRDGWRLERYGTDIFVLRAVLAPPTPATSEGSLLLACEGSSRQLRLHLPEPLEGGGPDLAGGSALLRGVAAAQERWAVLPVTVSKDQTVALVGDPEVRATALRALLDVLALRPASLSLLLSRKAGAGRSARRTIVPLHLVLGAHGPDPEVTAAFATGCGLGRR